MPPHGENVILILADGAPVSAVMKDIAEEIVVMGDRLELHEDVARIKAAIPDEEKVLAIFTDVFDCIFRFLGALLEEDGKLSGNEFWRTAAAVLRKYQMLDLADPSGGLQMAGRLLNPLARCA